MGVGSQTSRTIPPRLVPKENCTRRCASVGVKILPGCALSEGPRLLIKAALFKRGRIASHKGSKDARKIEGQGQGTFALKDLTHLASDEAGDFAGVELGARN